MCKVNYVLNRVTFKIEKRLFVGMECCKYLIGLFFLFSIAAVRAGTIDAPTNFRVDIYSNTALEIFWSRAISTETIVGYELNANEEVLWLGDVTSYFDSQLSLGNTYKYSLIAVDSDGSRSVRSNDLVVKLGGSSQSCFSTLRCSSVSVSQSGASDEVNNNRDMGYAIAGISLDVYSSSSAELFWDRATVSTGVVAYDITRDDIFLKRTNGISFYDRYVEAGVSHSYEIQGVDVNGNNVGMPGRTMLSGTAKSSSVNQSGGQLSSSAITVSGLVYSPSAAELFWVDSLTGSKTFLVYRNGVQLTATNGNSYYDDNLRPKSRYEYKVSMLLDGLQVSLGSFIINTPSGE